MLQELINELETDKSKKSILGYASAIETICKFLENSEIKFRIENVSSIIAMSEAVSEYSRKSVVEHFNCSLISRYSNVENGIIAQQEINMDSFKVNISSYLVEVFDLKSDNLVAHGVLGRIVITDYFNYGMPMIRYDTGDVGILEEINGLLYLTKVEGRKMDLVFDTKGDLVSSFTITNNMWLYPEVKQYQFIQLSSNEYKFRLNTHEKFEREDELIYQFKQYFGADAIFLVEYVDEIPLLNSGKRKKVMNLSV
jgi:phenylacetate-CoA ligase